MALFKTDGIREVGTAKLCRLAYRLGYAQKGKSKMVVGCDNRPDSEKIAAAVCQGLADADVDILYAGCVPTPLVQWACGYYVADGGIVVTASHNPLPYNGLKYVTCTGAKPSQEELVELESKMALSPEKEGGRIPQINAQIAKTYCDILAQEATLDLHIGVDCANGAGYYTAKRVLAKAGVDVLFATRGEGKNINRDCGATHPEALRDFVLANGLDVGFALDGDADRCIAVTKGGRIVDGDKILYLLCRYAKWQGIPIKGAVSTVMSNMALAQALRKWEIKLHLCEVGDSHVAATMRKTGAKYGAEPSGHILMGGDYSDGLRTGLTLCRMAERVDLDEWLADYTPYPQYAATYPYSVTAMALAAKAGSKWQDYLAQTGRVVVRESGTEPVIRVMVQANSDDLARTVLDGILSAAGKTA